MISESTVLARLKKGHTPEDIANATGLELAWVMEVWQRSCDAEIAEVLGESLQEPADFGPHQKIGAAEELAPREYLARDPANWVYGMNAAERQRFQAYLEAKLRKERRRRARGGFELFSSWMA